MLARARALAPQRASAADLTIRQKITTLRIRSIVFLSLALARAILMPSLFHLRSRLNTWRFQGEAAAHLISFTMKTGPAEAIAWEQLMQDYKGADTLAVCHKSLQQDVGGRDYCLKSVRTDPLAPAGPSAPGPGWIRRQRLADIELCPSRLPVGQRIC